MTALADRPGIGTASRRQFLSMMGAGAATALWARSPLAGLAGAAPTATGWELLSVSASDTGALTGLIQTDAVSALVELRIDTDRLIPGDLIQVKFPEGFNPTSVFAVGGESYATGSRPIPAGVTAHSPRYDELVRTDSAKAAALSAWELTAYEEETPLYRHIPSVVNIASGQDLITSPANTAGVYTEALAGVVGPAGDGLLLVGTGGRHLEAAYANALEVWRQSSQVGWQVSLLADDLGESRYVSFAANTSGESCALVTLHEGAVELWSDKGRVRFGPDETAAGLIQTASGGILSALTTSEGWHLYEVDLTSSNLSVSRTERDSVFAGLSRNSQLIELQGSKIVGSAVVGESETGYQVVSI